MSSLSITTVQANLHWEDKAANLAMLEDRIDSIQARTEIVVLPEMFNTGFSMSNSSQNPWKAALWPG